VVPSCFDCQELIIAGERVPMPEGAHHSFIVFLSVNIEYSCPLLPHFYSDRNRRDRLASRRVCQSNEPNTFTRQSIVIEQRFWPSHNAFLDLSDVPQITDGCARCTGVAVCDAEGRPTNVFDQGQPAHFFYEFELLDEIDIPTGGLEFHDAAGQVIHGKNTLQYGTAPPDVAHSGMRLRCWHVINIEVRVGEYWFTVGLASTDQVRAGLDHVL
jgi:hypothetical protein